MSAGNLGLPGNQIAFGFSEGTDPKEAREFAQRVMNRLSPLGKVQWVPSGRGAVASGCPSASGPTGALARGDAPAIEEGTPVPGTQH
jgi:hypothetical protein